MLKRKCSTRLTKIGLPFEMLEKEAKAKKDNVSIHFLLIL
jgi:hypothetical protein